MNLKACSLSSKPFSLLIVDDEPDVLSVTQEYLKTCFSFHVEMAGSGACALSMMRETQYDAIIADYEMEEMSGLDLLKTVRAKGDDIPFIIFTGKGREEVVIAAYESGADGYVQKGLDVRSQFTELAHKVYTVILKKQAEHTLVATYKQLKDAHRLAHIGIWDWDFSRDIITWSEELYLINGWDPDEPAPPYAHLSHLYTPESWQVLQAAVTHTLSTGEPYDLKLQIIRPDGTMIWTRAFGEPTYTKTGEMAGLHGMVQDITDWTRTEEALRQSEEKYRLIADNTADHIWIFDMDLNLTYSSPSVVRMKGFTVEETLSHSLHEIMTPASVESVLKRFEKEMALELSGGADPDRIVSFETEEYCKDGSTILVENKATLLRDAEGKPVGILGVSRDITERKQADYALQVSEERFRQLFNNASDAIFLHEVRDDGKPGVFIEVNDAACHKLGYTREELMNMEVSDINTPESNEMIPEIMPALFDKLHVTFECSHQKKDGEVIPVEVATHLFHLNNQNVILSICRDISERKSAEEALTRSERQLADIIDFLPDATFVVDKTGTIIAWNRAIEKMTGVLASDMLGKNNYEYALPFYGERRPILIDLAMQCDTQFPRKYSEFKRDGQQVKSESIIANFRGEDVTLWSIATPLYDQSGRLIGSIESIRDVSERKKTDDALHEALDTLKTVMDSLEAFVYVCDMQTYEILFINRFGRAICGEVIGEKCYRSLQKNQDGPCLFCTNEKIVDEYGNPNGGYVWEFQNTITKRWYQCHDRAIRWIDGRIVRLEISTDITKQKLAEHALKQANRQLNLLSEITRHDILNTVNAMQLLANLVEMKVDITPAAKDFENLETAISVIQSQIEFTRVYQDLGSHNPQWISLHNILTSLPVPQGIRLINNSADIEIFSDPLLNKVFENLLDNSIRHGKTVSTITISSKPGQHDMTIIFEDDGAGIPAAEKEVIFERGYGKNTGFGLFFIREILSITGIIISETGLEGIGVRFEISLPKEMWRYRTDH